MSDDADPQASDALAEQRVVVRYRLVRWRPADNEAGPFRADTIFAALRLIRLERDGVRFAADSLVEGAGFEPSVPLRAPGVLVVSVLVLCRLSVSGESSSGDMSPSRNLGCVTRYRRFESGFLKRRVHVSRRPGRCRVENRGFGSPSPFEWCIQHPRAAPQSGSVSDEPACTTVPAGHRV